MISFLTTKDAAALAAATAITIAGTVLLVLPSPARAVTFDYATPSAPVLFTFDGRVNDVVVPGLSATLTLQHLGAWNFAWQLTNTSTVTDSRVSIFGFNVSGSAFAFGPATGALTTLAAGNAPNGLGHRNLCVRSGPAAPQCAGGGGGGAFTNQTISGTFTLLSPSLAPLSLTFTDAFVRYQGVYAPPDVPRGSSGVGLRVVDPPAVPEPAAWAMLITGFGLVGCAARRRQRRVVTES